MGSDSKKALNQADMGDKQTISQETGGNKELSGQQDDQLLGGQKDRTYNPVDGAERSSVSARLNQDASRFKKGPGPF